MPEVRCNNEWCGTVSSSGFRNRKLLIGNLEGTDYHIEIKCPRCKTVTILEPGKRETSMVEVKDY